MPKEVIDVEVVLLFPGKRNRKPILAAMEKEQIQSRHENLIELKEKSLVHVVEAPHR